MSSKFKNHVTIRVQRGKTQIVHTGETENCGLCRTARLLWFSKHTKRVWEEIK